MSSVGNGLIVAGILLVVAGVFAKFGWLGWIGHLPGDFRIQGERSVFYFPIATMLLFSVFFTLIVNLLRKL